jgi:hypothetical protein
MNCKKCNAEIAENVKFCPECGANVAAAPAENNTDASNEKNPELSALNEALRLTYNEFSGIYEDIKYDVLYFGHIANASKILCMENLGAFCIFDKISEKNKLNITTACKIRSDETILALYDNTFWFSGKQGVALTIWGLRSGGYADDNYNWGLSWETLSKYNVTIDKEEILLYSGSNAEPVSRKDIAMHYAYNRSIFGFFLKKLALLFSSNENTMLVDNTSLQPHERRQIIVIDDNGFIPDIDIPSYTITEARKRFKFPPNHPVAGTAYAMAEVMPDTYATLSNFHEYFKQTKHAAFIRLCASLGAKEICLENATINNKKIDLDAEASILGKEAGFNIDIKRNKETGEMIAFSFGEGNKLLKEFDSPWINTEPTWQAMKELRCTSHLKSYEAEFNYTDDMGVEAQLTTKFIKTGIKIGGNFTEMTKVNLKYRVVFWEYIE